MATEDCRPYVRPFTIENRQSGEKLSFSIWRGGIQIAVYGKERGMPPFSTALTDVTYNMLRKVLKKVKESAPDTKIPFKKEKFDANTKQWALEWVISVQKDSKMCYHFIITNCKNNANFDFLFKGVGGVSIGADPLSESGKSGIQLDALEQWLERAYFLAPWFDEKFDPNGQGGRGGSSSQRGGASDQGGMASQPPASGADDMPW